MATIISTKTSGVGGLSVTGDASGILQLASADGTTALTINASQNVGIGTSSPTPTNASNIVPKLVVTGTGAAHGIQSIRTVNPGGGGAQIIASTTRGTDANSYTALQLNDGIGTLSFNGTDGTQFIAAATIVSAVDGAVSTNNVLGRLVFGTSAGGANSVIERMRIDSSGNVGIGVVPNVWSVGKAIEIGSAGNSILGAAAGNFQLYSNLYYNGGSKFATAASTFGSSFQMVNSSTYSYFAFNTTDVPGTAGNTATMLERMRIDSSGNVGIGTSAPSTYGGRLSVVSVGSTQSTVMVQNPGQGTCHLGFASTGSNVKLYNCYATGTLAGGAGIDIDSSGNLLVGTTSVYGGPKVGISFSSASNTGLVFYQSNNAAGTMIKFFDSALNLAGYIQNNNNNTVSYVGTSDQRLKTNIVDAPSALASVNAIKVRSFDWKSDGTHVDYGYIAQELLEVAPEAVAVPENEDEMMGVDFGKLTPRLVKAIQELKAIIDTQNARITTLEGG